MPNYKNWISMFLVCASIHLIVAGCTIEEYYSDSDQNIYRTSEALSYHDIYFPIYTSPGMSGSDPTLPEPEETTPDPIEDVAVWLLELKVRTATTKDAETDDTVMVRNNNGSFSQVVLNSSRDDREAGQRDWYSLNTAGIERVRHMRYLRFDKSGTDMWCFDEISLYVNGSSSPLYSQSFSQPHCIDGNDGYSSSFFIGYDRLREHPNWKISKHPNILNAPSLIGKSPLIRIVESALGHVMEGSVLHWEQTGHDVTLSVPWREPETMMFTAKLRKYRKWEPDPKVEVEARVRWYCHGGRLEHEITYLDVFPGKYNLERMFIGIDEALYPLSNIYYNGPRCFRSPVVNDDGSLTLWME